MHSTANAPDLPRLPAPRSAADAAAAAGPQTPVQQRAWTDLLGATDRRSDRPVADPAAGGRLRHRVLDGLGDDLARVPAHTTVWLNATALSALTCEGRYLDHLDETFAWSVATVVGTMTQHALAIDVHSGRSAPLHEVVDCAWRQLLDAPGSVAGYVASLGDVDRAAVRAGVAARCAAVRDCFPAVPSWLHPRVGTALTWRLSRRVVVKVVPDLTLGRPDAHRRMLQMVDFKTGSRLDTHAGERGVQALLATVKYGVAPFRVATYYLDEAAWDADDITAEYLAAAAEDLLASVRRAIRLTAAPPKPAQLDLRAGPACTWCARAPDCPLGGQATSARLAA